MRSVHTALAAVAVGSLLAFPVIAPAAAAPTAAPAAVSMAAKPPALLKAVGGDKMVTLTWRPPVATVDMKVKPTITYNVMQAGAGMIESRTSATTLVVKDLNENTRYTFTVVSYLNGKKSGQKKVTALTKPGQLVNPRAEGNALITWNPPVFSTEPLTYNVYKGNILIAPNVPATSFAVPAPEPGKTDSYAIAAANPSGEGPKATISVTTPKPTSSK